MPKYLVSLSYPSRLVLDCEVEAEHEEAAAREAEQYATAHPGRWRPMHVPMTVFDVVSDSRVEQVILLRSPR